MMPPQLSPTDLAECRTLMRGGSRSFFAASLLLPRAVREPACALYAFCRLADDAIDGAGGRPEAVGELRARLDAVYAHAPRSNAADRALAAVVHRYGIPRELPAALIEGFEWDAQGRVYETYDELTDYAARVAGTVGAMMALLMGVRHEAGLARACDLGVAMQLSNIARDVAEDAAMGRLYLPRQWLREAGIDPDAWLASPRITPELLRVVQRLLDEAQALYRRVDAGVALLPPGCRPGINAARYLYAAIGDEVRRRGPHAWATRTVVPPRRKALLLARSVMTPVRPSLAAAPPLRATEYLVRAAVAAPAPRFAAERRTIEERAVWVIDLFERLERQERARAGVRVDARVGVS